MCVKMSSDWRPALVVILSVLCGVCFTFNLEPRIPVIKRGPSLSHFGYAVALHKSLEPGTPSSLKNRYTPWMLVGAPKGENLQPGTNHSGALYKCPLTTYTEDCEQVLTDGLKDPKTGRFLKRRDDGNILPPAEYEIKDDQWMGVTVKSQGEGGFILVCAHRYQRKGLDEETYRWGYGLCYRLTSTFEYEDNYEPCLGKPVSSGYQQFGYCQAGTSGLILDDEVVLGVPGTHSWRGTVYSSNISADYLHRDKTQYFGVYVDDESPVNKFSYLGYSVTAGNFFGDEMSYVAGAPRAGGTGQVVFFHRERIGSPVMPFFLILKGETLASSFGTEVIAMDINGDKADDLVVSAPFHFTPFSSGAVYIYMNDGRGITEKTPFTRLEGPVGESRFGQSMTSLGDLNHDGYGDLAVGAPYDKNGAIYIYLGSKDGIQTKPSQIIRAEDLPGGTYDAFGYALSGGMDIDGNGYNDLLTSSFCSDRIVLLRGRPILDIVTKVRPPQEDLIIDPTRRGCDADPNALRPCFSFQTCFKMMSGTKTRTYLQFKYNITERFYPDQTGPRVRLENADPDNTGTLEQNLQLRPEDMGRDICNWQTAYLKEDQRDVLRPIRFKLTYEVHQLEPTPVEEGKSLPEIDLYPILNQEEAVKYFEASFAKDCGDDDICVSDLGVEAAHDLPKSEVKEDAYIFELGNRQFFNLFVNVTNSGEPAYLPNLYIAHDKAVDLRRAETETGYYQCLPVRTDLIQCKLDNPLVNGTGTLHLVFKLSGLPFESKNFILDIWANSTSQESNQENNRVQFFIDVKRRAEISIIGSGEPEQVFYSGEVRGESAIENLEQIGNEVVHNYLVDNGGPWRVDELHVDIMWPYQVENNKEQGKWLLYLTDIPFVDGQGECDIDPRYVNPLKIQSKNLFVAPEANTGQQGRYVGAGASGKTKTKVTSSKTTKKYVTSKKTYKSKASSTKTVDGKVVESDKKESNRNSNDYDDEEDYETYDNFFNKKDGSSSSVREETSVTRKVTTDHSRSSGDNIGNIEDIQVKKDGNQAYVYGYDKYGNLVFSSQDERRFGESRGGASYGSGSGYGRGYSSSVDETKSINAVKDFEIVRKNGQIWIEGFDNQGRLVWSSQHRGYKQKHHFDDGDNAIGGSSRTTEYSYKKTYTSKDGKNKLTETYFGPDGDRSNTRSWTDEEPNENRFGSGRIHGRESRVRFDWSDPDNRYHKSSSYSSSRQRGGSDSGGRNQNIKSGSSRSSSTYSQTVIDGDGDAKVYSFSTSDQNADRWGDQIRGPYENQWTRESENGAYTRTHKRTKREEATIIKAEAITDSQTGKTMRVVNFRCDGESPTAKCFSFRCTIRNLDENQAATIRIRSRLWNSTLIQDYPFVNYVSIKSNAELILPEEIREDQDTSDDFATAETVAYSGLLDQLPPGSVPIWVYVVSILAGLLLLIIIGAILYKIGFFKRKRRPDPTLSGNIDKNGY